MGCDILTFTSITALILISPTLTTPLEATNTTLALEGTVCTTFEGQVRHFIQESKLDFVGAFTLLRS